MMNGRIVVVDFKVAKHAASPEWRAQAAVLERAYPIDLAVETIS